MSQRDIEMAKIRLVVPEEPCGAAPTEVAQADVLPADASVARMASGATLRIGVLDNSKGNADHLLASLVERLRTAVPLTAVVAERKPTSARPATDQVLARLAQETDCVVSAMGD
jgi:hypothetical protein